MRALELTCLCIVLLYIVVRLHRRGDESVGELLSRFVWLAATSALGEDTMIRLHGFYDYAEGWSLPIDRVPLLIVLIWPIVIDSASQIAGGLCRALHRQESTRNVAIATGLVVLVDAWLIEPIATQSGLWRWHAPGLFGVPPIGVLGWAIFAGLVTWLRPIAWRRSGSALVRLGQPVVASALAILGTHAILIAAWWLLFRPLNRTLPTAAGIAIAWLVLLPIAAWFLRIRAGRAVPVSNLLVRVPAAAFFFVLLAVRKDLIGAAQGPLLLYALSFAAPYWVLVFARSAQPQNRAT